MNEVAINNTAVNENITARRFADLILDMGTFLLASGAHSGRVNSNIRRIALAWGFTVSFHPSFKGLLVTVQNSRDEKDTITLFKESPTHIVHLEVLTRVSHLSWKVYEQGMTIEETEKAFQEIKQMPHYNHWLVAVVVGFACAGLCLFSFGDWQNAIVTWLAAFVGSLVRYKVASLNFNSMISIGFAAFVTTTITGLGSVNGIGIHPEAAMATGVLYLIPGVPLVNGVIDLIEGYLSSAVNRYLFAGFILLCIAAGMMLSITFLGINNFSL
ncbi:threonine/serine exporter family protein [Dysgonomonas macrotermitis]|uniref:Uncharacterized membrane protein YjjP, DUF1212 family n=1 Tax=Dysgonomonas macrotermitis TaxID=1346286 RepID=A0A1M5H172_9BACT|nr:threonine/serine exporter family protein [Dysgonomonas macrotermitis]SHG09636.1 Uncharacterized membrane protein YjjP, DUF1212 family [Dysgonomonas macrotermitis]